MRVAQALHIHECVCAEAETLGQQRGIAVQPSLRLVQGGDAMRQRDPAQRGLHRPVPTCDGGVLPQAAQRRPVGRSRQETT